MLWSALKDMFALDGIQTQSLKKYLTNTVTDFPLDVVRITITEFVDCLQILNKCSIKKITVSGVEQKF